MFAIPKSDPLDLLLFGVGLRLTQLAKVGDPKFSKLLENRNFTIQMGSEAQDLYRTFSVENGRFTQTNGKTEKPSLSILFKDSMTGAKLLTKGDATAFMMGVQNGDVKMSGDYSLLMWFNQVAKHIIPKVPEQLQPAVEAAKPFITKATPIAKDLCEKAMSLLSEFGILKGSDKAETKESSSKYFKDAKKDDTTDKNSDKNADDKSLMDTAKEKLTEVKAEVEEKIEALKEKFDDVKDEAKDKLEAVKDKAEDKAEALKDKVDDVTQDAKAKLDTVKSEVKEKTDTLKDDVQDKAQDIKSDIKADAADLKDTLTTANDKLNEVKTETSQKLDTAKDKADTLTAETKDKLADIKAEVKQTADNVSTTLKADTAKTDALKTDNLKADTKDVVKEAKADLEQAGDKTQSKFDELKAKLDNTPATATTLTPAMQQSQALQSKHADEKIIADNVTTAAVKDDKSPITNITITRADDKKSN